MMDLAFVELKWFVIVVDPAISLVYEYIYPKLNSVEKVSLSVSDFFA